MATEEEINKHREIIFDSFLWLHNNTSPEQAIGELECIKMLYFARSYHLKIKDEK